MDTFVITYKERQPVGKDLVKYHEFQAASSQHAQAQFIQSNPGLTFVRVDNKTLHGRAAAAADQMIRMLSTHENEKYRRAAIFSKPIAELAVTVLEEFGHLLKGDKFDLQSTSKNIFNSLKPGGNSI